MYETVQKLSGRSSTVGAARCFGRLHNRNSRLNVGSLEIIIGEPVQLQQGAWEGGADLSIDS
jgi:hypothetical protein